MSKHGRPAIALLEAPKEHHYHALHNNVVRLDLFMGQNILQGFLIKNSNFEGRVAKVGRIIPKGLGKSPAILLKNPSQVLYRHYYLVAGNLVNHCDGVCSMTRTKIYLIETRFSTVEDRELSAVDFLF
jgi:hypothetical protein